MLPAFNQKHIALTVLSSCVLYLSLLLLMDHPSALMTIICSLSMIGSLTYINISNWMNHPSFTTTDFILACIASTLMTFFFIIGFCLVDPASTVLRTTCLFFAAISGILISFHFFYKMIINKY